MDSLTLFVNLIEASYSLRGEINKSLDSLNGLPPDQVRKTDIRDQELALYYVNKSIIVCQDAIPHFQSKLMDLDDKQDTLHLKKYRPRGQPM